LVGWRDFLSLKDGEYVIHEWTMGEGIVALTNQRLVHLKESRVSRTRWGKITSIDYVCLNDIPLELITGIELKPGFFTKPEITIYIKRGTVTWEIYPNLVSFEQFRGMVMEQIKERRRELEMKKMPVIDFSFIKTFIEKGGIVLTTLKCPNCSAPIKMPKNGTETVCGHCGSTIYAQDIFEKVKTLIG